MVEEIVKTYHVAYERDESGWWVASVREVRGCHTQGRTVDEARRRIRKAMELFVDDARSAKFVDNVKLPAPASKAIRLYAALRKQADREDQRASLAARRAVRLLRGGNLKMSARDAARLLGVSHPASSSTRSRCRLSRLHRSATKLEVSRRETAARRSPSPDRESEA